MDHIPLISVFESFFVCRKYCANDSAKTITHSSAGVPQLTNTFRIELSNYDVVVQLHRISHLIFIKAFLEKQWRHQSLITVLFSPPNNVFNGLNVLLWQTYKGNKLKDLSLWVLWPNQLIVLLCYGVTAGRHEKCNSTTYSQMCASTSMYAIERKLNVRHFNKYIHWTL